jgi:hypothetical protein
MVRKCAFLFAAFTLVSALGAADLPGFYRHVDSVDWVVQDLGRVASSWRAMGFSVEDRGEVLLSESSKSGSAESRIRLAEGDLAGFRVAWIEPVSGENAYSDFLRDRGEGVFSLNHLVPDQASLDQELARMSEKGVASAGETRIAAGKYIRRSVRLETRSGGQVALALVRHEDRPELPPSTIPIRFMKSQYAFVVRDLRPPSDYWAALGFPQMEITHGALGDLRYRGQPGRFDQRLGWQRHGDVTFEWIEPLKGPTVYEDAMQAHGQGFHHFAFNVDDMADAIDFFQRKGYAVSQAGTWGTSGKPGSGSFAYIDTDAIGGVTIELLWSYTEH